MESRQVILLTRGYTLGWLDFDYKQPLSKLRESFLLREIEKDIYKDSVFLRSIVDAALLSSTVGRSKKALDIPYAGLERYSEITLPYIVKKTKMEDNMETAAILAKKDEWKAILEERKKALKAENKIK